MPRIQTTQPSHLVRSERCVLEARFLRLERDGGTTREWRHLQYDAYCALVHAQVRLVELHTRLLTMLRADRDLYEAQRNESLELSLSCGSLRELITKIVRGVARAEAAN